MSAEQAHGPFDPDGVTWQRVSTRLIPARYVTIGPWFVVPILGLSVLAVLTSPWVWLPVALLVALAVTVAAIVPRQVRAIGYVERDDDLLIRKGVMFRSLVVVPYGRMQFVDVSAGPIARAFRIASVQLHTASASTDATIDGLEPSEAARLRDRLASRGEARLAGL